jgi:hypothetical protein
MEKSQIWLVKSQEYPMKSQKWLSHCSTHNEITKKANEILRISDKIKNG